MKVFNFRVNTWRHYHLKYYAWQQWKTLLYWLWFKVKLIRNLDCRFGLLFFMSSSSFVRLFCYFFRQNIFRVKNVADITPKNYSGLFFSLGTESFFVDQTFLKILLESAIHIPQSENLQQKKIPRIHFPRINPLFCCGFS